MTFAPFTPPSVDAWETGTSYDIDVDHTLTKVTPPDGRAIVITQDDFGRTKSVTHPDGETQVSYDVVAGRVETVTNADEQIGFQYDGPLVTSATFSGLVAGSVEYSYTSRFDIAETTVNNANATPLDYDRDGLLVSAGDYAMTRDARGLPATGSVGSVIELFGFNEYSEQISYSVGTPSSGAIFSVTYEHDDLGRITKKTEVTTATTAVWEYGYDLANRLLEVKKDGASIESWTYDAAGNRATETKAGVTVSATYDAQDRLLTYGDTTFTWGKAGDLQSQQRKGEAPTIYTYDALGNLVAATLPDGKQLTYVVDPLGRRIAKKVNGAVVQAFLWESQLRIAAELDAAGNVVGRFVYGTKVNVPELILKGDKTYRVVTDHIGSPRYILDSDDGSIVEAIEYDAWGNVLADSNPGFQPFGFAGGLFDGDLGLVRFGVRDYDAGVGRWTWIEPLMAKPPPATRFVTSSLVPNAYAYANGNPLQYHDPNGVYPVPFPDDGKPPPGWGGDVAPGGPAPLPGPIPDYSDKSKGADCDSDKPIEALCTAADCDAAYRFNIGNCNGRPLCEAAATVLYALCLGMCE